MINANNLLDHKDRITPQYLAGLFDGEGCVSVGLTNNGTPRLRVSISQKNPYILHLISFFLSANIYKQSDKKKKCSWHQIVWTGAQAIPFLEYIKDHVIIKKDLVENGLLLAQLFKYNTNIKSSATDIVIIKRKELFDKILAINHSNKSSKSDDSVADNKESLN